MPNSNLSDVQLQNLLASLTDRMLAGEDDFSAEINQSEEAHKLLHLVARLDQSFEPVKPSERFTRRLRQDLVGTDQSNMLVRVRRLPPRVQIAAGIALVAGFVFLSRRHLGSETAPEAQETAIAQ